MNYMLITELAMLDSSQVVAAEIIARRVFPPVYMLIDSMFLIVFVALLVYYKRYMSFIVGAFMGVVYFLVDYGIFHLALHTRSITEGYNMLAVLFWMSMSYGFTNFCWIWLALSKDRYLNVWTTYIIGWWLICPPLSRAVAAGGPLITIQRTTETYHPAMLIILVLGYGAAIIYNLSCKNKNRKLPILRLNCIGILAQFGWEFALLIGGIRSVGMASLGEKIKVLLLNSLLETNLGMPYVFMIFAAVTARYQEDLQKRVPPLKLGDRIEEINLK